MFNQFSHLFLPQTVERLARWESWDLHKVDARQMVNLAARSGQDAVRWNHPC